MTGSMTATPTMTAALNVGETWQFAVSYTVTQDDIDNGGVVDPALTHDNTATATTTQDVTDDASASVLNRARIRTSRW